jgi:hypothetical protein
MVAPIGVTRGTAQSPADRATLLAGRAGEQANNSTEDTIVIASREFIRLSGGPGAARKLGQTAVRDHIVVVGGGETATTLARFLHLWGAGGLSVTLIEPDCNRTQRRQALNPNPVNADSGDCTDLASRYGIRVLFGQIQSVDPASGVLALADGTRLPFDRLVVAPGVELTRLPAAPGTSA